MRTLDALAVVAAVNDEEVLRSNLARSPLIREGVPLLIERGCSSAGIAYNRGLSRAQAEIVVFAHQDVYLPEGWHLRLFEGIEQVEQSRRDWAVIGVFGATSSGAHVGRVWSSGLGREIGGPLAAPQAIVSADELVLVIRRESGVRFDEALPGFHLYGTDIVQTALEKGLGAFVVEAPVVHNSRPIRWLDGRFRAAWRYARTKWNHRLPVPTCILPLTRSDWPLLRSALVSAKHTVLRRHPRTTRASDPIAVSRRLSYESPA
jgi:hypothetical protein